MPQVKLLLNSSSLFFLLAAIVAVAFSIFAYRRTVPPIPSGKKWLLITLRSFSLFLLLSLFLEPILGLVYTRDKPPALAILVDNSRSMSLVDRTGERAQHTRDLLAGKNTGKLSELGKLKLYRFAETLKELPSPDSLHFDGGGTDISTALKLIKEKIDEDNIQAVILVTDGNYNLGENPLHEAGRLNIPIFTIGIGDSAEQKDLLITKVVANEIVYEGSRVPLDATVKSSGFDGEQVEVALSEDSKQLDRQTLTLRKGTWEYTVKFAFEPKDEGLKRYTVSVSRLEGEITTANNTKAVFVKVLKSRMKVVLLGGAPSPDVAFVRRALEEDKNVELRSFVQRDAQSFYEGEPTPETFREAECFVLVGFPLSNSRGDILRELQAEIEQRRKPVLFLLSRNVDLNKLRMFDSSLPFVSGPARLDEASVYLQVLEGQRTHPIMTLGGSRNLWSNLPPIYKTGTSFRPKPEAEVLAVTRIQEVTTNEPLIISRNVAGLRSVGVTGYGIWRWKLLTQTTEPSSDALHLFVSSCIRWLTTREESKLVKIVPTKEVFTGGEPVELVGQVYDRMYKPIEDAEVKVIARKNSEIHETILSPAGNGRYEGAFDALGDGEYEFSGSAVLEGDRLGEDKGRFSVGALDIELQQTRMNKPLLEQIAYQSGAKYLDAQAADQLADKIKESVKLASRELRYSNELQLWSLPAILLLIILLFVSEWYLRKQSGLL